LRFVVLAPLAQQHPGTNAPNGSADSRSLILDGERNWKVLTDNDVYMEEPGNDGSWLRPWLRFVVEFNK